jgi:hypothetical protein
MPTKWLESITLKANNLAELQHLVIDKSRSGKALAFRGYYTPAAIDNPLEAFVTGLERACQTMDGGLHNALSREVAIIREFKRRAHHFLSALPEKSNWLEWLALMQHHGAPTRLLDWTYSLHIAAYFAFSKAVRTKSADLEIWMIDTGWCRAASISACKVAGQPAGVLGQSLMASDLEEHVTLELFAPDRPLAVWPINPFRMNERLTLQKGIFLAPGRPAQTFVENLLALRGHDDPSNVARFIVPHSELASVGKDLYDANVTEATLFPGLDGFARSLWTSFRYLDLDGMTSIYSV